MNRQQAIARLTASGEPHEITQVSLFGATCRGFKNAPVNLGALFNDNRSDATFVVYEDERYTFEQMYQAASGIAALLVEDYGVQKGDRVAISMRNYPEWIMTFSAVTSIGAIVVAMNALWNPEEMEYGLIDSGAKVLFADSERVERLQSCSADLSVQTIAVRAPSAPPSIPALADLLATHRHSAMPTVEVAPEDDATIFYTSGSTGHPKGAVSCHRNIITALLSWELDGAAAFLVAGVTPPTPEFQPATLLGVPLFHATGSHAVYLASYRSQRKLVSMYKWDPELAADLIEQEKISSFVAPAAMTGDLIVKARESERDLSTLASVGGGGAPRAPEQVKNIEQSFANAMPGTGWGMTETNAIGTGIGGQDYLDRPASSGRCSAVLDLRIVDDQGKVLVPLERGELQVRGTTIFRGYWNRADATAETFDDGWLKTGDVAYLDEEGFVFIVDRIKDLVIRGGENIGCGEVEAALLEHPAVVEVSVYAVPDDRLGEEVGATYYSQQRIAETELREFLIERLAKFKVPRYLLSTTEPLPRIASGKIFKRQIREHAIKALI